MRAPILVLPLLLALGACSSDTGSQNYIARVDTPETIPATGSDASMMLVQMPAPGGLVTSVREKSHSNGIIQQAVLDGSVSGLGENHLEISVQTSPSGTLSIGRPSQDGIRREIVARYPKIEMRIVTQPRQNGLGVFGLAIGRAGNGARCVFAWQWIDDVTRGANSGSSFSFLGGGSSSAAIPAAVRIHMCRKDATVDDLAATVEGLTLAAPAIVSRALDPSRLAAPTVSARSSSSPAGNSNVVADGSLESALGPHKQVMVAEQAPAKRRTTRVARRRTPTQPANEAVVERTAPVAEPAYSNGPRYLAPVASSTAAPVVYGNPAPVAAVAPQGRGLDPSLPAAAYRGPTYRGN